MYNEIYIKQSTSVPLTIFEEIDSTNEEAKRRVAEGVNEDFALISKTQTAGKGRKGRSFYSPKDTGIYLTYVHFSDNSIEDDLRVTVCSSVLAKRAIKEALNIECGIKWVNDLYYKEKKICGILCECILKGSMGNERNAIIVGIGINLSTSDFPEDIMYKAGSLIQDSEKEVIRKAPDNIVISIINGLKDFFENHNYPEIMEEYCNSSIVLGKKVELSDAKGVIASGEVTGFDEKGAIVVNCDGENQVFDSGEISLILK